MDREQALDTALGQIERQFGKGSVMRMGDASRTPVAAVSTGSLSLDNALGIGGYRAAASSRSSARSRAARRRSSATRSPRRSARAGAAFIDAEHAMTPTTRPHRRRTSTSCWCRSPTSGEQALEIVEMLVRTGAVDDGDGRLGRSARAEGRDRGRDRRLLRRPAGAAHDQALRKLTGRHKSHRARSCIFTTSCARRSVSCSATRRRRPAATRYKFYATRAAGRPADRARWR